jgi:hypothetical protein
VLKQQSCGTFLGFVVPCFFKYSNKTFNQMQQSIVTFIVSSHRRRSTCFVHHRAHHQELFQTKFAASGCRVNEEVVVFPAVVRLLLRRQCEHTLSPLTNGSRLETRPPPYSHGNRRLQLQFERAPDDGHDGARNMLSGVYVTKQ